MLKRSNELAGFQQAFVDTCVQLGAAALKNLNLKLIALQFGRFCNEQYLGVKRHVALFGKGLDAQGIDVVNLVANVGLSSCD